MAFMFCLGNCCTCGTQFTFNPENVPSFRGRYEGGIFIPDQAGKREPVCRTCFERGNEIRKEKGLEPLTHAANAYDYEEVP